MQLRLLASFVHFHSRETQPWQETKWGHVENQACAFSMGAEAENENELLKEHGMIVDFSSEPLEGAALGLF